MTGDYDKDDYSRDKARNGYWVLGLEHLTLFSPGPNAYCSSPIVIMLLWSFMEFHENM